MMLTDVTLIEYLNLYFISYHGNQVSIKTFKERHFELEVAQEVRLFIWGPLFRTMKY